MRNVCLLIMLLWCSTLCSQTFVLNPSARGKLIKGKKIYEQFFCTDCIEANIELLFFTDSTFFYELKGTGLRLVSDGTWTEIKENLILESKIKKNNVFVKVDGVDEGKDMPNMFIRKTPFIVPKDLRGKKIYDSKVFINNDSTYCFPYFDTCVGRYESIDSIKVSLGNGFTTRWLQFARPKKRYIEIIAESYYLFTEYIVFERKTFKRINKIKLISK